MTWNRIVLLQISGVGLIALGSGCAGYGIAKMRLEKEFEARFDRELKAAKLVREKVDKTGEFSDPVAIVEKMGYTSREIEKPIVEVVEKVEKTVEVNIFDDSEEFIWDEDSEADRRKPGVPYIISQDDYMTSEIYTQTTYTWYESSNQLADEKEEMIHDLLGTIGPEALSRFGHGSNDKNVVYIRNDRLELDIELLRDPGHYHMDTEGEGVLEHSYEPRNRHKQRDDRGRYRKFRLDDE